MNWPPRGTTASDSKPTGRYADRPEMSWSEAWAAIDRAEEFLQRLVPTAERAAAIGQGLTALMGVRRALVLLKGTLHRQP